MTASAAEFPEPNSFPSPEEDAHLAESAAVLEDSRLNFLHSCSTFADQPTPETGNAIGATIQTYSQAVGVHLSILRARLPAAEFAQYGMEMILIEDGRRVDFFNGFADNPQLDRLAGTQAGYDLAAELQGELVKHAEDETDEDVKNCVMQILAQEFGDDITRDTTAFITEHGQVKHTKMQLIRKTVGKHALDISKTAVGAAAGIAMMQLITRRRR